MFDLTLYPDNQDIFEEIEKIISKSFKSEPHYPPYNIYSDKDGNTYIEMAVTGFSKDDINITLEDTELTISGTKKKDESDDKKYFYRGLSRKSFIHKFQINPKFKIDEVTLENGLLVIKFIKNQDLVKKIEIK